MKNVRLEQIRKCGVWVGMMAVSLVVAAPLRAEVRAGGVGGMNLASLSTNATSTKLGTLKRWGGGGVLELDLSPTLALAIRPMYVGKGTDIKSMPGLGDVSAHGVGSYARTELGYIELPLLVKYSIPTGGAARPYLIAGPSLGLLQRAEGVSKFASAAGKREDIKKDFKSTDVSLNAGAGVGANVGQAHIFAEGLYAFGVTNINKDKAEGTGKNRGLQFRVGITLRLGAK
jgi:Outer membrane protein beta-barrel domain